MNKVSRKPTFDAGHLFATRFAEQCELACHRVEHLDKVGQKQYDLHLMVGQVATTTDALSALNMRSTQQRHCGVLM